MNHAQAFSLAQRLVLDLHPACRRIEIAGSLRRGRPDVKDIELVAIPTIVTSIRTDMFGEKVGEIIVDLFEERVRLLLEPASHWEWTLDGELPRNGPRYKRLRHMRSGICCDLFLTTERGWGGALAIRTGPADFSRALVTLARRRRKHVADGYLIHGHPKPRRIGPKGEEEEYPCPKGDACSLIIPTPEEADFFAVLDLPLLGPMARTAEFIWRKAKTEATG